MFRAQRAVLIRLLKRDGSTCAEVKPSTLSHIRLTSSRRSVIARTTPHRSPSGDSLPIR
jgi:hypothetical protein